MHLYPMSRLIALGEPEPNERAALGALDAALNPDWIIFHSRKPLQGRPDIDVLIVTPDLVFAAELKHYRDTISVNSSAQWQRQLADGSIELLPNMLQGQTQKQAQRLKTEWKAAVGLHHVWIEPVVIFTHEQSRLRFDSADGAALEQVVFCLPDAKARLENLVARHRTKMRRAISRADLEAIAATFDAVTLPPASQSWSVEAAPARTGKSDDRLIRERRRRTKKWMAILTLVGALLVTIATYMVIIER
jgi:Nuclease-related domain